VAGIPDSRNTYYFGATGGGVWKTQDAGTSWTNVSDGYFGGSIGAVAVSAWDPNVVYVGAGEKTIRGNVSPGTGMWKSTDAGLSWASVGLTDSQHISRVRIHPKNPDVVYAAVMGHLFGPNRERGVFRSTDGGTTWQNVLFVNENAGAVDLVLDPVNPRILYASFWRVHRTPYSLESGGEGSGIWKSTDGGDSWHSLSGNEGLPRGITGISGIDVSPSNNQNVYAIVEADDGGVFRSRDGGETWEKTNEERDLRQRAWYYTRIYADPADEESVYVLNVGFHYSKDGGRSFTTIDVPHGDNHDMWIDPADPLRMIQANDGGANVSFDRGATWSTQSNQPTAQMYRVSTDNDFPYRLLGGQQDNSAVRIRSQSARGDVISVRDWEPTAGGESGHVVAKPDEPDLVVGGSYGGYLRVLDHRTGSVRAIDVWPDNPMGWGAADLKYRFQWNFPIAFSLHDPDVLYVAANVLFRSENMGDSWDVISPDLTRNDKSRMGPSGGPITKDNTSIEYYGTIFAMAESPLDENVIWVGSDDGRVHVTRTGGDDWTDVTPRGLPEWAQVNSIEAHPRDAGSAYLAATRYKQDDFEPYLFRTSDYGRSWQRINDGIPDNEFTRVVRADPDRNGLLYAGTEFGIYVSFDDGRSWSSLQLNLPQTPITDLAVKENDLIAATQGRGYWILDDLDVLHQLSGNNRPDDTVLYTPGVAYRLTAGGYDEDAGAAGTNPPTGAVFYYSLPEEPGVDTAVSLSVYEQGSQEAIWTWTRKPAVEDDEEEASGPNDPPDLRLLETAQGLNRFVWDLRYPGMERFDDLIMWADMRVGPRAVPGRYRAALTVGDVMRETEFVVAADPRSNVTADDYLSQFEFLIESRDLLSRVHAEIRKLRTLKSQLDGLKARYVSADGEMPVAEPQAALVTDIDELIAFIDPIEQRLYQTKNESRQDPLNYPIRLNNKLTSLMRTVDVGDSAPSAGAQAVKSELVSAISATLAELDELWKDRLPALNQRIQAMDIQLLNVPSE